MTKEENTFQRGMTAIILAAMITAIALAFIIVGLTDAKWYVGLYIVLFCVGIILLLHSFILPQKSDFAGPSDSNKSLVSGIIVMMLGVTGLVSVYVTSNLWVLAGIIMLAIAIAILLVVIKSVKGNK